MARTPSNMLPIGTIAPPFELKDTVSGQFMDFQNLKSEKGTVVMFICNHCPYVIHIKEEMVNIAKEYTEKGIAFIAISSNDVQNYPDDSPEKMKEFADESGFVFPYLYDETQDVAKAYDAACTPDFYVFDGDDRCIYRGRMDGATPGNNVPVTGTDLRNALDALMAGKEVNEEQLPSMGCNIKWK